MTVQALPAAWYVEPSDLADECKHILRPDWHYVGDATDVDQPGTFTTGDLCGVPIVVTRDTDGRLRGFANICAHRGAVVARGRGRRRTLQCPYHGWMYRLDGELHRAPSCSPPSGVRLTEVGVDAADRLLFASIRADHDRPSRTLRPFLDLARGVAGIDLNSLARRVEVHHRIRANWNVVVENFIECYHCPLVHPTTLPGFGGADYRVQAHGSLQVQRLDHERFVFGFLFPTTQISIYGSDRALVARSIVPCGADATAVRLDYWFAPSVTSAVATTWVTWFESVVAEDIPLCESVQTGLSSRLIPQGLVNPQTEPGPVHFQDLLKERLAKRTGAAA